MKKFLIASVGGIPPTSVLPPGARINFAQTDRRFLKKVTLRLVTAWLFAQMLIASTIFGQVLTHGPAVRDVTASEAKVFVRTDKAASVTLCYGSDPNLDTYLVSTAFVTSSPSDFIKVISLSNLIPKTSYYLNVLVNGVPQLTGPPYPSFTTFPPTPWGTLEQYGTTSTGVALRWTAFVPHDGGRHPAVLVLHAGGFKSGDAGPDNVSEDLAAAGFLALSTEYRLAPPHYAMNTPDHPAPSQNTVVPADDGYYPEQTTDVQMAIRAARQDPRCNGLVYGVGGSAGASHVLYCMARGTPGDDQFDLGVSLSNPCKYDDVPWLQTPCIPDEICPQPTIENYLGIPAGSAFSHLPELAAASPTTYVTSSLPPFFFLYSDHDASNFQTFERTDLISALESVGITESTAATPQAGKYKQILVATGDGVYHAFEYWDLPVDGIDGHQTVKDTVITWLRNRDWDSPFALSMAQKRREHPGSH